MKYITIILMAVSIGACSTAAEIKQFCEDNSKKHYNKAKICGDIKPLVTIRNGGVNLNAEQNQYVKTNS